MNEEQIKQLNNTLNDIKAQLISISTYIGILLKIFAIKNGITIIDKDEKSD